jgi:hypothetical protein
MLNSNALYLYTDLPWVTKIFLKKVRGLQVISYFHVFDGFAVGIIHGKRPWVKIPWVYAIFLVVNTKKCVILKHFFYYYSDNYFEIFFNYVRLDMQGNDI